MLGYRRFYGYRKRHSCSNCEFTICLSGRYR